MALLTIVADRGAVNAFESGLARFRLILDFVGGWWAARYAIAIVKVHVILEVGLIVVAKGAEVLAGASQAVGVGLRGALQAFGRKL